MARARAKAPKKKTLKKTPAVLPPPAPAPPGPVDRSLQEMQAEAQRLAAKRRVASFLERTLNLLWMRRRVGSFETSLIGGLRNLLAEAEADERENRSSESYSAHYSFLYGTLTAFQHIFFWKAIESKLADREELLHRAPEPSDMEEILQELNVFHTSAVSDVNQAHYRRLLAQNSEAEAALRKRIQEQANAYEMLNPLKDIPKA